MQATAKEVKLSPVKKGKKNFSVFPFVNGLFFLLFLPVYPCSAVEGAG